LTVITRKDIKGADQYEFSPWLYDYFAAQLVPKNLDFLDMHCSPGLAILEAAKPNKYVVSIIAHDLALSISEHERYFGVGTYPYRHNTDSYLHSLLLKHAKYATAILTPSTPSANWIHNNIREDGIVIIPHGCHIPADSEVKPLPETLMGGYLGGGGVDKGLVYLLMALNHFDGKFVFGGSCKDWMQWLSIQTRMPLTPEKIGFTGWLENISDFYNQISVYVQPSSSEGFGIEIIEAMAHGRPVIATTGTCGPDVISDGVDGFVVPARDPAAILERMIFFRDNPGKIAEMGIRAREKAMEFSWEKVEQKYIEFYKGILGGNHV
jgi:glycosyltransferase involved in cell wall biosynthesis